MDRIRRFRIAKEKNVEPLIIECALNEQVSRTDTPHVPISDDEIVSDGLEAAEAGASILHFHAREPETGALLHPGLAVYQRIMKRIRAENPDVLVYPTYGASPTKEERFSHLEALARDPDVRLEFATIDPGAVNYAGYAISAISDGNTKELGWDYVLSVSHEEMQYFLELSRRLELRYSFVVRELGHVRHVLAYREMGWTSEPLLLKITMSENHAWGVMPSEKGIRMLTTDVIPPEVRVRWMTYVEGLCHPELSRYAVENGGHVRTGIGDNPRFGNEQITNAQQVDRVVEMARKVGRSIATPSDVRAMMSEGS